uniref:DZF domain-containing protein n=1 Tax=Heligmosomoides polygyrus TaxID=6339 RepID=A0A183FL68_HELPZ
LLTLKCGPPLDKEPSREEIKLAERTASILKDFEAHQLETEEDEQLEVVEEQEEDWDPQDELMNVER